MKRSALKIAAVKYRNFLYYSITYRLSLSQYTYKHLIFPDIPFQKEEKYDVKSPEIGIQAERGHRGLTGCLIPTRHVRKTYQLWHSTGLSWGGEVELQNNRLPSSKKLLDKAVFNHRTTLKDSYEKKGNKFQIKTN